MTAAESLIEYTNGPIAFGSLLDLARLQIGGASAETCDACSTINLQHARLCKCCAHRLPASYARTKLPRHKPSLAAGQAWAALFTAITLLVHSLSVAF